MCFRLGSIECDLENVNGRLRVREPSTTSSFSCKTEIKKKKETTKKKKKRWLYSILT